MLTVLRPDLPQWRRIRAESLPRPVVDAAAAARAAGDWAGAAALARCDVDVRFDPGRFDAAALEALYDDLRHLSVDLLWWHLPRHRGGMSTLQAMVSAILAPRAGADLAPLIRVRLPKSPTGPQRLQLTVTTLAEIEHERWYFAPRYTWDVREAAAVRAAWGGSADRMPFLTPDGQPLPPEAFGGGTDAAAETERTWRSLTDGDLVGAWRRCGIDVSAVDPEALQRPSGPPTLPVGVADEARAAAAAFGVDQVSTLYGASLALTVHDLTAEAHDVSEYLEIQTRILTGSVPPDLALIAAGHQRPGDLHPLVKDALFPSSVATQGAPVPPALGASARVRCQGAWHRVEVTGGALRLPDHDEEEQLRERMLRTLGGTSSGCYATQATWTTGKGRLPHALAAQVRELKHRMQHGDTDWLLDGLDRGVIDPHVRDANGWSLLHLAMWVDFTRVLPVLLAAGVPVDARDHIGRTPLYLAVMDGGPPELMRRLLAEGADPRAETVHGSYPAYVARSRQQWQDLKFVAEA
ncbi:ankyrin repeat domain-containing protein [Dactylosporangium cerinum]|uniref:Ankyrin repeat domain-containing protein n=1 Tax=Dactylosporangium cerinum TaxID=1434730 RepID=A0ABV9W6L3_9ACTN